MDEEADNGDAMKGSNHKLAMVHAYVSVIMEVCDLEHADEHNLERDA